MAAHGERHAQIGVARFQQRKEHGLVRLRSGIGLHVRRLGAEQLLDAIDRKLLGHVGVFAAAVITLARVTLGILVRELRALGFQHGAADVVLGRDQLDVVFLSLVFQLDDAEQIGVEMGEVVGIHGGSLDESRG